MNKHQQFIQEIIPMMNEDETADEAGSDTVDEAPKKKKKGKKVGKAEKKASKANGKSKPTETKKAKTAAAEDEEGMVSLTTLAEEAGISGAVARRKLRTAELDRGDGRWKWKDGSTALKQARKALGI